MTAGRKLLLKATVVLTLGAIAGATEPKSAKAATLNQCGLNDQCHVLSTCEIQSCPEQCPQVQCIYDPFECIGSNDVYRLYCGWAS
jgi:hypothetical protein